MNKANSRDIDRIKAAADIVEEVDALNTYIGFCAPGTTDEAAATWSIMKITQSAEAPPIITRSLWAAGFCSFNLIWNNRAAYAYTFKNF